MQRDYITTDQHVKIQSIDPVTADEAPTKVVEPVNDAHVELTTPLLSQDFQDTIRFIRETGCRPGEARKMQVGDLDRETWLFKPTSHKNGTQGEVPSGTNSDFDPNAAIAASPAPRRSIRLWCVRWRATIRTTGTWPSHRPSTREAE